MEYKIYYIEDGSDDFIAAVDASGEECVRIMDPEYFPYFRNKEGTYDLEAIASYFKNIEDVSSWREIEEWHTLQDIENGCSDGAERPNIIYSSEMGVEATETCEEMAEEADEMEV